MRILSPQRLPFRHPGHVVRKPKVYQAFPLAANHQYREVNTWCGKDAGLAYAAFSLELDHLADWLDQLYTAASDPPYITVSQTAVTLGLESQEDLNVLLCVTFQRSVFTFRSEILTVLRSRGIVLRS